MTLAFLDNVHADPWSETFVDLPTLNGDPSDSLEATILELRQVAKQQPQALRSTSTVVLGPPGAGKTHLFSRLRRRLGPRAVFVHIRPLVGSEMTPRLVLSETTKQLGYATNGLRQVDALVGYALAHVSGKSKSFPRALLELYRGMSAEARAEKLDAAVEHLLEVWPEADEVYLRRLLQVPFEKAATRRALLAWLSGRDCDSVQLARIGASAPMGEEVLMHAMKTLSAVAALGAPIVLVFDQLENLIEPQGVSSRLAAYTTLTSELVDSLRGVAMVHMALDSEWAQGIDPTLNLAQRSRLVMKLVTLQLPTHRQREELLRVWLSQTETGQSYPWPFREDEVTRLLQAPGMTPRMLLLAYRRALQGEHDAGDDSATESEAEQDVVRTADDTDAVAEREANVADAIEDEWKQCLEAARTSLDQGAESSQPTEAERLADGLITASRYVTDLSVAVTRMRDPAQVHAKGAFGELKVALAQQAHPNSLGSVLKKLAVMAEDTSVLAIREQVFDLPPTWKSTLDKRTELLAAGARWHSLAREDSARLLALVALAQGARSGDVTDRDGRVMAPELVDEWIRRHLEVGQWGPIAALTHPWTDAAVDERGGSEVTSGTTPSSNQPTTGGVALMTLLRLRVASVDRLIREVNRLDPKMTRNEMLTQLEAQPDRARFIGRTLVCAGGER